MNLKFKIKLLVSTFLVSGLLSFITHTTTTYAGLDQDFTASELTGPNKMLFMAVKSGSSNKELLHYLKQMPDPNITDDYGKTALHWAVALNNVALTKCLLLHGLNPNAQDKSNYTPLHYAVIANNEEITKILLKSGADPNIAATHIKLTPLHFYASVTTPESINLNILRYLLKYHANIYARNCFNVTALDCFPRRLQAFMLRPMKPPAAPSKKS